MAGRIRLLREYRWPERYISDLPGMNSRLDELQAAILQVKLHYLDQENDRRRHLARLYDSFLPATTLILPKVRLEAHHVYHQYVVRSERRYALRAFLTDNSVGTLIHYPVPVHLQPAYRERLRIGAGGLEHIERLCREILSLPMHPQMSDERARRVGELILRWDRQAPSEV